MKDILLQAAAMTIGFVGGVMYARDVYRPLIRAWKRAWRKERRKKWDC